MAPLSHPIGNQLEAEREVLQYVNEMGVRIALDDFGTGFANIGYLQRLSFDGIKIDRSFLAAAIADPKSADLAKAIIAIGNAIGVRSPLRASKRRSRQI